MQMANIQKSCNFQSNDLISILPTTEIGQEKIFQDIDYSSF